MGQGSYAGNLQYSYFWYTEAYAVPEIFFSYESRFNRAFTNI